MNVECADIPWGRGLRFRIAAADDDQIFVDDPRTGQRDRLNAVISPESFPKIDAAAFAEALDWPARSRIQSVKEVHDAREHAALVSVGPIGHTA